MHAAKQTLQTGNIIHVNIKIAWHHPVIEVNLAESAPCRVSRNVDKMLVSSQNRLIALLKTAVEYVGITSVLGWAPTVPVMGIAGAVVGTAVVGGAAAVSP